jgi:hypothetical protein
MSVAFADFAPSDLVYRDRVGETYRVRYNPTHRWFYVPEMRADEAVLIKCYDSVEDGTARFTAHSASGPVGDVGRQPVRPGDKRLALPGPMRAPDSRMMLNLTFAIAALCHPDC